MPVWARRAGGIRVGMEPIPETTAFMEEFGHFYDPGLLEDLTRQGDSVRELVPDLVGLSLAVLEDGVAFTLVATDADVAVLDAIQYMSGGPCVDAADEQRPTTYEADRPDDERQWHTFAESTAAKGVSSTLTLPILDAGGNVVGSVNLYAASHEAFTGLHDPIADIFDAWAPGAVTNADLSFQTRRTAEHASDAMRASMRVEIAVGKLMEAMSVNDETARGMLEQAAQRAGVPLGLFAETVLEVFESRGEG